MQISAERVDPANGLVLVSISCRLLAQHKVSDGGDEGEGEGDPRQDVAVSVPAVLLVQVEAVRVDGGCDHDAEAGKELKDAGDGEPLSLWEGEELSHEHEDAQDGEYTSEH